MKKTKAFAIPLMIMLCLAAYVERAHAQSGRIVVTAPATTLKQALDEIDRQSPWRVTVNWNYLDPAKRVVLPTGEVEIATVLKNALGGTDHTWEIFEGNIIAIRYAIPPGEGRGARSAMVGDDFRRSNARFIPDPWSRTQKPFDNMVNTRIARMSADPDGRDSTGMAVVNFRVGKSLIENDYMDNARALAMLERTFQRREILSGIDYMVITAGASPEGNESKNETLAAERAMAVKSYIMWRYPFLDRDMIYTFSIGEDWTGLRQMVVEDLRTPYRDEVLYVLDSYRANESKEAELRRIGAGAAWRHISANMLPMLRGGVALTLHYKSSPRPEIVVEEKTVLVEKVRTDTVFLDRVAMIPASEGSTGSGIFAIKTNLLYDLALLPNLAVEIPIGGRWSIEVEGMWSWWNTSSGKHLYHRVQAGGLEVRKWLGAPDITPLKGHFIGVYGYFGNWDLRFGDVGYQSPKGTMSAGLTYGYSTPIGRRTNLEFAIGIGYLGGEYYKYTYDSVNDRYPWRSTQRLAWFGPTKAKISLVWRVGNGKNEKKY